MTKTTYPPRLRSRVGTGDDQKFYFEISMWDFAATKMVGEPWTFGPFETEKEAHEQMKLTMQKASDELVRLDGGKPDGTYLDMKNGGTLRPWVEQ